MTMIGETILRIENQLLRMCVAWGVVFSAGAVVVPPGSQVAPLQPSLEVELPATVAPPGKVAVLPLTLHLPPETELERIEVRVGLPPDLAQVKAVRIGKDNEEEGTISHRVESPSEGASISTIIVEVRRNPLVAGELARLILAVGETTAEESYILPLSARGRPAASDREPVDIPGLDGVLIVSTAAPVFGCFFYMH